MPILDIRFFGECRFTYAGEPVAGLQTKRMRSLLGYIILHAGQQLSAAQLAFLFWPDSSEKQARTNLRRAFYNLRQTFPQVDEFMARSDHSVLWRADADYALDIDAFEADIADARRHLYTPDAQAPIAQLEAAVARYQGDLLPDCYDDWVAAPRERLRQECLFALEQLTLLHEEAGHYAAAIRYGEILLRHDSLRERSYRTLMQLYLLDGDRPAALRVYHACASELARELGVDPGADLTDLYNQLLAGDAVAKPATAAPSTLAAPAVSTPTAPPQPERDELVGRKAERRLLTTAWRKAAAGHASVVLIHGEAGMGKTRLAEDLYRWAEQLGITTVRARAYEGVSALAYAPIVDWLRAPKLAARVDKLDPTRLTELSRLVPEIRLTHPTLPPPQPLTESWQRTRLFEALAHTVCRHDQPLLLWIDDLQWCDGESLAWLQYLLQSARTAPLLVLGTVRDDELDADHPLRLWEHALRRSDQLTEIVLAPLTREESIELGRLVSHGRLSDHELAQHSLWAAGNPLFMLEMARAAVETAETGAPTPPSDAADPVPEASFLPPKVYNVIQARLSKLSATAQTVAALAATVGRSFTVDLLLHAGELDEGPLVQALDELWRRRIIREGDAAAGDAYDFSHDRIRDVAYSRLSTIRRRFYHRALAAAMTDVHAPQLEPWSAQIAHHHDRAGNHAEAASFYTAAASWAAAQFAHTDTIRYLSRALDLIDAEDRNRRFELHKARAQAYQMQAARPEQAHELDAMMALATAMADDDKRTEVLLGRAALAEIQGNYADAVAVIEQISWRRAPAGDAQSGAPRLRHEVDAAVRLGSIYWNQGDYPRAEREYRHGLKAAQQVGDRVQEATILLHLGALNAYFGPYTDALQISRAALDASRAVGNEEGQIWAQNQVGFLIIDQGDDDLHTAEAALTAGLDLARKTGNRTYIAKLANNLAMLYDRMGKYAEGHACLDEARSIAEKTGSARHQAFAINYRGNMLLNQGELDAAADAFARALAQFQAIGYRQGESKTLSELAVLYLIRGDAARALEHADAARTLATQIGIQRDLAAAHTRTGYVLESQGRWQAAEEMYTQARQLYHATGQQRRGLQPYAGCARIAWATGNQQTAIAYVDDIATRVAPYGLDATCEAQWVAITCAHISGTSAAPSPDDNSIRPLRQPHLDAFRNAFGTPQSVP